MNKLISKLQDILKISHEKKSLPACPVCGLRGEEVIGAPLTCSQDCKRGLYCNEYLEELKYIYITHNRFISKIYEDEDKYREVIELLESISERTMDQVFYYKDFRIE